MSAQRRQWASSIGLAHARAGAVLVAAPHRRKPLPAALRSDLARAMKRWNARSIAPVTLRAHAMRARGGAVPAAGDSTSLARRVRPKGVQRAIRGIMHEAAPGTAPRRDVAAAAGTVRVRSVRASIMPALAARMVRAQPVGSPVPRRRATGGAAGASRPAMRGTVAALRGVVPRQPAAVAGSIARLAVRRATPAVGRAPVPVAGMPARRMAVAPTAAAVPMPAMTRAQPDAAAGGGTLQIDGMELGRWVTDHLTHEAMRPPRGVSGFDDRLTPVFAGVVGPA